MLMYGHRTGRPGIRIAYRLDGHHLSDRRIQTPNAFVCGYSPRPALCRRLHIQHRDGKGHAKERGLLRHQLRQLWADHEYEKNIGHAQHCLQRSPHQCQRHQTASHGSLRLLRQPAFPRHRNRRTGPWYLQNSKAFGRRQNSA
uniref:Uncharacterized protein n=1 Tax=Schistocephalus solidus TaxID=70667 RepID=A0A0X3QA37_SCHSO